MKCFLSSVGLAAVLMALTVLFYEGLSLPFVGQVVDGAVAHRLDAYVSLAEKTAADARAAEAARQAAVYKAAYDKANQRAAAAEAANAITEIDRQKERADYEAKLDAQSRGCYLDDDGRDFLLRHQ